MNKIFLTGRLTKDPEVKYTPGGKAVATFTIAVDRPFTSAAAKEKGEKEADFIPVVVWGNTAEFCGNYLNKGSKILVEGRLQLRSYEKDGAKKIVTEVIGERVESLTTKPKPVDEKTEDVISSFGEEMISSEVPF